MFATSLFSCFYTCNPYVSRIYFTSLISFHLIPESNRWQNHMVPVTWTEIEIGWGSVFNNFEGIFLAPLSSFEFADLSLRLYSWVLLTSVFCFTRSVMLLYSIIIRILGSLFQYHLLSFQTLTIFASKSIVKSIFNKNSFLINIVGRFYLLAFNWFRRSDHPMWGSENNWIIKSPSISCSVGWWVGWVVSWGQKPFQDNKINYIFLAFFIMLQVLKTPEYLFFYWNALRWWLLTCSKYFCPQSLV